MNLQRCVELYKMMSDRCAASGCAENQAQIYSEMADFIAQCSSVEDSMSKIKNSKYYLAPSVALMKDKIGAWQKAAHDNDMPELEKVYADKLAKINNDDAEIYVTGYEQTAQNIKNKYVLTYQAFVNIFNGYVGYIANGKEHHLSDIDTNLKELKLPSSEFSELANMPRFRELIPIDDDGYRLFVDEIQHHIAGQKMNLLTGKGPDEAYAKNQLQEVLNHKKDVKKASKNQPKRNKWKEEVAIAPEFNDNLNDISNLKYTYEEQ